MSVQNFGRVYQNSSTSKLIRLKSFFVFCKFPLLVKNMQKLYKGSTKVIGLNNTNKLVKLFYGDIFVGGENSKELETSLLTQKENGLLCIADYAREFLTAREEKVNLCFLFRTWKRLFRLTKTRLKLRRGSTVRTALPSKFRASATWNT